MVGMIKTLTILTTATTNCRHLQLSPHASATTIFHNQHLPPPQLPPPPLPPGRENCERRAILTATTRKSGPNIFWESKPSKSALPGSACAKSASQSRFELVVVLLLLLLYCWCCCYSCCGHLGIKVGTIRSGMCQVSLTTTTTEYSRMSMMSRRCSQVATPSLLPFWKRTI